MTMVVSVPLQRTLPTCMRVTSLHARTVLHKDEQWSALALPLLSTASEPCAALSPARQLRPVARHLRPVWQLTPVPRQPRPHNKYIECTKPLYAWYQMAMTLYSPSPNHCFKKKSALFSGYSLPPPPPTTYTYNNNNYYYYTATTTTHYNNTARCMFCCTVVP